MTTFLHRVLGVVLLGALLFGASRYGGTISYQAQKIFHLPGAQVKSAEIKSEVAKRLQSDAASGAAVAKKQVMQVKVSDVVGFFGRVKKISTDLGHVAHFVASETGKLTKGR